MADSFFANKPAPPAAELLGWELVSEDPKAGTIEIAFHPDARMLNPQGTVQGGKWTRGAARLALATGAPLVPVRIIGTKRALSQGRIGFGKIRLIVCEPILVEQAKPTLAAAKALTAELEKRVGAAR